jgi:hypothetical protein
MPPAPTVTQLKSLHNALTSASSRFTSYNFHPYFSRRVRETWAPVLSTLDPPGGSASVSAPQPDLSELARFYEEQSKELEVIKRAGEVNRMFEGPKLVVEHARPITSGGGAGMEASAGGGGQPDGV